MIRAIVSLRRDDGTYPDVGMWNRTVVDAKTLPAARRSARSFAKDRAFRVEYHNDTLLKPPFRTEFW